MERVKNYNEYNIHFIYKFRILTHNTYGFCLNYWHDTGGTLLHAVEWVCILAYFYRRRSIVTAGAAAGGV